MPDGLITINVNAWQAIAAAIAASAAAVVAMGAIVWRAVRPKVTEMVTKAIGEEHMWMRDELGDLEARGEKCRAQVDRTVDAIRADTREQFRCVNRKLDMILEKMIPGAD